MTREKRLEWPMLDFRSKPQCLLDGGIAKTRQRTQQRIARHRPRIIVTAFVFVPRIARSSVVAAAHRLDDRQALWHKAFCNQVRCHLIFNPGPDFIRIYKGQRRLVSARPTAQQEPWLVSHRISRTLRIRMLTEIRLEIVPED